MKVEIISKEIKVPKMVSAGEGVPGQLYTVDCSPNDAELKKNYLRLCISVRGKCCMFDLSEGKIMEDTARIYTELPIGTRVELTQVAGLR